jgi:2'-5' RNA ligase
VDSKTTQLVANITKDLSFRTNSLKALDFVPHFSIRNDFEINDQDIGALEKELKSLISKYPPFALNVSSFGSYPWKIIYLNIDESDTLNQLHREIMNVIQKFRTPWVHPDLLTSTNFQGQQLDYIKKYGYQFAFEFYSPHFTVAGNDMSDQSFIDVKEYIKDKIENIHCSVEKIVLLHRDGNSNNPLIEFSL